MNKYFKSIATAIAGATLLLNIALPVLADTSIQISGNGSSSDNAVVTDSSTTTTVTQSNTANVNNDVSSTSSTGSNDANYNTGGTTTVDTGSASVTSNVSTSVNSNTASTNCCGTGDTSVLIQGNGADSTNQVNPLSIVNTTSVEQNNTANINNDVSGKAYTGGNDANQNTGGSVTVMTGDASVTSNVTNKANENIAMIGAGSAAVIPTASFKILGNGADSTNYITAELVNESSIEQNNHANINNDVEASAKTGGNDANFNTGGDVTIDTGSADVESNVNNMANFNFASADCGCLFDILAKIDGNGSKSQNTIALDLISGKIMDQGNHANLNNDLEDVYAKTGYNDANSNTGSVSDPSDPTVMTGDSAITNNVNNKANINVAGGSFDLPEGFPFGGITTSFDWSALLAFLEGIHVSV